MVVVMHVFKLAFFFCLKYAMFFFLIFYVDRFSCLFLVGWLLFLYDDYLLNTKKGRVSGLIYWFM